MKSKSDRPPVEVPSCWKAQADRLKEFPRAKIAAEIPAPPKAASARDKRHATQGPARDRLHALLDALDKRGAVPTREELGALFALAREGFETRSAAARLIEVFAKALELDGGKP